MTSGWPVRPASNCGFSLIEVLAALIVVSLGLLGVIEAVSQTASNTGYLRDKSIAHWIAMNRLTEIRLEQQPPKIAKTSDEVEMASRRWRWTVEVTQSPLQSVRRIEVKVRTAEAKEGTSLAALTGFYGAAIAPPGRVIVSWEGPVGGPGGTGGLGDDDQPPPGKRQQPTPQQPPPTEEPEPQLPSEPTPETPE